MKTSYKLNEYRQNQDIVKIIELINSVDIDNLSVLEAYPNTYVWYIWNDFGSTKNSFKKLEILKELEQLNR